MTDPVNPHIFNQMGEDLKTEATTALTDLAPALLQNKMEQQTLLMQSARDGGPVDNHGAIHAVLDFLKLKPRRLAQQMRMSRLKVTQMINGQRDMTPDDITALWTAIEALRPGELERLRKM